MIDSFRVEKTELLLHSHVFEVQRRFIRHADGILIREIASHDGAVAILVINDRDEIGLIRQYRSPFDRFTVEIPAGTLDVAGEEPLHTAQRELREEMGYLASSWTLLGRFMNSPGWTNQVMTIYEARGLTMVTREPDGPEESSSQIQWLSPLALREVLRREDAIDSTLAIALHRVYGTFFDGS